MIPASVEAVLDWCQISSQRTELLVKYCDWLLNEALPAGGLGPAEADRVWSRHIADSIALLGAWTTMPERLLDLGSGVGLPGIPMAIVLPDCQVTLLDRSARRARLLRRCVRVLGLENAEVEERDIKDVRGLWPAASMRAVLRWDRAVGAMAKVLEPTGRGVVALSSGQLGPVREAGFHVKQVEVLDHSPGLLIIEAT